MTQGTNRGATASRMKTRGAVIVTRVSTGEQVKNGTSLESQRDACRAKAQALGLRIIDEYEDVASQAGHFSCATECKAPSPTSKSGAPIR